MPPPETPQEYLEYFQTQTLYADPPAHKWVIGLQAAQLWDMYHEQAKASVETLLELIHVLMPYRFAGSGFHALWLAVLYHLRELQVEQQILLWSAIFDRANHGERVLLHPERVEAILQYWHHIAQQSESIPLDSRMIFGLVKKFGPDLSTDQEWISLAYTINVWVEARLAEPSFIILVFEQYNASIKE